MNEDFANQRNKERRSSITFGMRGYAYLEKKNNRCYHVYLLYDKNIDAPNNGQLYV